MPNIKSAKKRVLVNEKKKEENKSIVSEVKTLVKKFNAAVDAKNKAEAEVLFKETVSLVDSACLKGIYQRNTAARKESQLAKKLNTLA